MGLDAILGHPYGNKNVNFGMCSFLDCQTAAWWIEMVPSDQQPVLSLVNGVLVFLLVSTRFESHGVHGSVQYKQSLQGQRTAQQTWSEHAPQLSYFPVESIDISST